MQLTLAKKVLLLVAVPLVFEIGVLGGVVYLFHQAEQERAREAHSIAITNCLNRLLRLMLERSFTHTLKQLSGSDEFGKAFQGAATDMKTEIAKLEKLCSEDPTEKAVLTGIAKETNEATEDLRIAREGLGDDHIQTMRSWIKVRNRLKKIYKLCDETIAHQIQVQAREAERQARTRRDLESLLIWAAACNVALAIILSMLFNRATTERLKMLMQNTMRLASNEPLNPPLRGGDEMAVLDRFFRSMANALTEARRKERAVVDNVLDIICSIDENGKFSDVNPASTTVWGYTPEELDGKRLVSLVTKEEAERVGNILVNIMQQQSVHSFETSVRKKDGVIAEMLWTVHWSNEERELFCVTHDVSERKKLERLKRDFIAMVSHDLKTPLTSIQMVHSLLEAEAYGKLNEDGHRSLEIADESVTRLINLVSGLLDIERIESGELDLKKTNVKLNDVLEPAVEAVSAIAEKNDTKINVQSEHTDLTVPLDEDRIIQVIINLLSNAIKYSDKGKPIEVSTLVIDNQVEISVTDHGCGIAPEMCEVVFERFKQTDAVADRKKGGTGLGLAICRAIVERHQGEIGVESEPGKGSRFWFRLPLEVASL